MQISPLCPICDNPISRKYLRHAPQGLLSEAVLAVEAEVTRNPGNADAWRMLGTVQAENDDDRQAIAALCRQVLRYATSHGMA